MTENPYQSPMSDLQPAAGVLSGKQEDVRAVAVYQKGAFICILVYLLSVIVTFVAFALPEPLRIVPAIGILGAGVVGTVFVFLLAVKLYGVGIGVLLGLLTLLPCLGLVVLVIVSNKATNVLEQNGHHVGLLGANLAEF